MIPCNFALAPNPVGFHGIPWNLFTQWKVPRNHFHLFLPGFHDITLQNVGKWATLLQDEQTI